ncbi:GBS Bsp-like repeat protein, partial [[Clostridium] scindens ATCC 35704]|uniref:GBS Bsp-like repeat-containing protein n=1 Tax=Clostridium scindens (strain JCM 10418 / VPI 12708) TaxID=29347 RepID=UPI0001657B55
LACGGFRKVEFAVWSLKGGQDDLAWYQASRDSSGAYRATVPISRHRTAGEYEADAYITLGNGGLKYVGKASFKVTEPGISRVEVSEKDVDGGTFTVSLAKPESPSGVNRLQVAVWGAANGQNDLKWYDAAKRPDGSYEVAVSIANHGFETGTYNVHTYLTGGNGISLCANTTSTEIEAPKSEVTAKDAAGTETNYELKATNLGLYGDVRKVEFAVWSLKGGQDDLAWYQASRDSSGAYRATVPISRHRTAGEYEADAYITLGNGGLKYVGKASFKVTEPGISKVEVSEKDVDGGTFTVSLAKPESPSGVNRLQVAVWGAANGQNDLKWYDAAKRPDGSYEVAVSIANHGFETGTYNVHTYLTGGNGISLCANTTSTEIEAPKSEVTAKDAAGTETNYELKATNLGLYGDVRKVEFAVWSLKGGQDDLAWYQASRDSSGAYRATVPISRHRTAGEYEADAYITLGNGGLKYVGKASFKVTEPGISKVEVSEKDVDGGTFTVSLAKPESPSGVNRLQVAVWGAANGQNDLKWYDAAKRPDGSYEVAVSIANHGFETGTYNVHTYLTGGNGISLCANTTSTEIEAPKSEVTATDAAGTETNYELKATNLGLYGDVRKVEFAVWSLKGGQDDLVWYQASRDSSGAYRATVPISRHRTTGEYEGDAYITLSNGTLKYVGTAKFEITIPSLNLYVANYDASLGSFDVILNNIVSPSGINKIEVPVWCSSNQSDIKWYKAVKQNDGTYKITVDPMYHNLHSGIYQIHAYITTGNGIMTLAGTTTQLVKAPELYTIMGTTTTTVDQMMKYYKSSGVNYPGNELGKGGAPTLESFCKLYLEEANAEGVRAEVAFAQTMLETGWLKYGGIVKIEQFNFAGIGALDGNSTGNCATFPDVRTGIRAQIQHLKAYGSSGALTNSCVDPRFHLVKRNCAPYVQWLGQKENPQGNGWATSERYGYNIMSGIQKLKSL